MDQQNGLKIQSLPAGAMFEVDASLIDEGKFMEMLNEKIRQTVRDLLAYWKKTQDFKGAGTVSTSITFSSVPMMQKLMNITYVIDSKLPKYKNASAAQLAGDKLLCQPIGTNKTPEQLVMYDHFGRPIGAIDTGTGEVKSPIVADQHGGVHPADAGPAN